MSVNKFIKDNHCSFKFDSNGFAIKDRRSKKVKLRGPAEEGVYRLPVVALENIIAHSKAFHSIKKSALDHSARLVHHTKSPIDTCKLQASCGADWAGSLEDKRSTCGVTVYMSNNLISWSAKKWTTIARYSTEVEYRTVAQTTEIIGSSFYFMNLGNDYTIP